MRHGSTKAKFRGGYDANKMLMRKLAKNFFTYNKLTTTDAKAKALKSLIERLVEKTKKETEANKNYLLKSLADEKMVALLFKQVGPVIKDKVGGYVKLTKINQRINDGSIMTRVEWAYPVVKEEVKVKKEVKKEVQEK